MHLARESAQLSFAVHETLAKNFEPLSNILRVHRRPAKGQSLDTRMMNASDGVLLRTLHGALDLRGEVGRMGGGRAPDGVIGKRGRSEDIRRIRVINARVLELLLRLLLVALLLNLLNLLVLLIQLCRVEKDTVPGLLREHEFELSVHRARVLHA